MTLCFFKWVGIWHCFAKGQSMHRAGLGYSPEEAEQDWKEWNGK